MWFRVLGPLEVYSTRGQVPVTAQRQQIILMTVLLEAGRLVTTDRLIEAVWGHTPPATAKQQVHICVSRLRKLLTTHGLPETIGTLPPGYVARVPRGRLDLTEFHRLVGEARQAADGRHYYQANEFYRRALALWRGSVTTAHSGLLAGAAARLEERRVAVVEEWTDLCLRFGRHQELVGELMDLVARHPLREGLRARLMLALYRSGRQAEALEVYRAGRRLLVDELGIEPDPSLRRLEARILAGELDPTAELDRTGELGRADAARPYPLPTVPTLVAAPPRMLPCDVADFTGQAEAVARLRAVLGTKPATGVPIAAVNGKVGVGKTTVAVHVGHLLADDFPDGQLFVRLNGLGAESVAAVEALGRCLHALGVPVDALPAGLEERAERYRQLLADRRALVILDDAADEEQVRWLLPGSPSCAVIVTSRLRLTGLPGAVPVEIRELPPELALTLLSTTVGAARVHAEPTESARLVAHCEGLPLALRIAGARLAARPHWSIGQFVRDLADERRRLDLLVHRGLAVRTAFARTYEALGDPARALFRRLGSPESEEFPGWLAAPLLDAPIDQAEEALEELVDAHFVDPLWDPAQRRARFALQGLLRTYARTQLTQEEPVAARDALISRWLSAWLSMLEAAGHRIGRMGHPPPGGRLRWALPTSVVGRELADPRRWYQQERHSVLAAVRQAARRGAHELCWRLALASAVLCQDGGHLDDWWVTHRVALAEVRRVGDRQAEAALRASLRLLRSQQHEQAGRHALAGQPVGSLAA